jgi:hypothetical protein
MGLNHGWRGPNIVRDGLVLYLDAGSPNSYQGTGTTWKDISKVNQNNGTLVNGPTFSTANGGSIVFDGTDDYVTTTAGSTPILNITSQITLETWLIATATASVSHGAGINSKGLSSDNNSGVYETLIAQSGGINYPFFRMRIGSSTPSYFPTSIALNLNQIYHFVSTYNGSIMRIFINGVESGTGLTQTGNIEANTERLVIGCRYRHVFTDGNFVSDFSGRIYNNRIYNRALTPSEVLQNYNATKGRFGL